MKKLIVILCVALLAISAFAEKRAQTVEDMWSMKRIGDVALSPDGQWLVYVQKTYCMESNSSQSDLWIMPSKGGEPRQLTTNPKKDLMPRWFANGTEIAFLSDRNGSMQVYKLSLNGGEAQQMTAFPVGLEDFILSPDNSKIAFSAHVFADAKDLQETADRDKAFEESKVKARVIDHLLFRSWNRWTEGKRTHVFVSSLCGKNLVDLTPGEFDAPPLDLGGSFDYAFSPDGSEVAFVSNHDDMPAASTNNDVFIVPVTGGKAECITAENDGVDNNPVYSPDGKYLAYKSMATPGFEADQYQIILYDRETKEKINLTKDFDRSPNEVVWSPDSKKIFFNTRNNGRVTVHSVDVKKPVVKDILLEKSSSNLIVDEKGKNLFLKLQSVDQPYEIFTMDLKGNTTQLSFVNKDLLDQLEINKVKDFEFKSFDGQIAHGFISKPPFFDESKKYPMIFLIHGGPQGMWNDGYHYRWNVAQFAAPGYVVIAINPRGSKGYGQEWCNAVSKDWGDGPYKDLMTGLDYVLETYNFIDADKIVAAGASYGGFMINWIATHNDRFKALVSHAGVFDQRSMYGATEELWFPEWEFDGTVYENPELFEKWSPSFYVKNFKQYKTPTLVVHGEHDYRVPVTQGYQMFTALQRMGVPSRLLYFPDETHFISKPQNARLWWSEVFDWYDKWLK